ncbi:MAG: copper homeostasis protein CutC [Chitinophagaceae bacterium]|nr:copper homeostasis protein CutC [Chitinophagaceae bacterium]
MATKNYKIEIATSDFATTKAAVEGGADRIELCANLFEGGTTPSYGTIQLCREKFSVDLFPIIRPRGGDFLYSDEEFEIMLRDVRFCKQTGCDGVVIGLLQRDGTLDKERTALLIESAYPLSVSFHRAFDRCIDPFQTMKELIELGCERILTSGQQPVAEKGIELIAALQKEANGKIIIMPGSGVKVSNIQLLAQRTGCMEFHASLRRKEKSMMDFMHPSFENDEESYRNNYIDSEEVRKLKEIINNG